MGVAAMAAEELGVSVAKSAGRLDGLALRFQRSYPKVVAPAWLLATSADLFGNGIDRQRLRILLLTGTARLAAGQPA